VVMLYVGGKCVGRLPEDAKLLAEHAASGRAFELRDEAGWRIGQYVPEAEPTLDLGPEEIQRRLAEPGYTYEEMKKRLGWE
jgi:hypothetical protein